MTNEEYKNLKYGDVIVHCSYPGYYIVHEIYDNSWIDCQELNSIGRETEYGYIHNSWEYEYCTKITNEKLLEAIHFIIEDDFVNDRNEFVRGAEWMQGLKKDNGGN